MIEEIKPILTPEAKRYLEGMRDAYHMIDEYKLKINNIIHLSNIRKRQDLFLKKCKIDAYRYAREGNWDSVKEVMHLIIDAKFLTLPDPSN